MDYERVLNTNFNFTNINIYNRISNGVHTGYQAIPYDGYVMYDTNDEEIPIYDDFGNIVGYQKSYFTLAGFPLNYNFDNFSWVAVLRSEVDENYIFGGGDNHEVM